MFKPAGERPSPPLSRSGRGLHATLGLSLVLLLAACAPASLKRDIVQAPPSYAEAPASEGVLADLAAQIATEHGPEYSGFRILDSSYDALYYRLLLMDSAVSSLDIQTYLWYPDASGKLLLERAVLAAQRGVKVRLIVDDLILHGHDQLIANLQAQPNIEFRMFNPWKERGSMAGRAGEMIAEMERLNTRMHDKLMIVDGHAAVVGGRNIGDHYFGLSEVYNFNDTDLLGIGAVAGQANEAFDGFWNSKWVVSADYLTVKPDKELAQQQWETIQSYTATAPGLAQFPRLPGDWSTELREYSSTLRIGRSKMVYDEAEAEQIDQRMLSSMFNFFNIAQRELLIMNAYIIPSQHGIDAMRALTERGVEVSILTNSLSSHDVPAVNSHYEPWRDDFIKAGVNLYEMRSDPAIKATVIDVPPIDAGFSGLHSKCAVADGRYVFVGSMNLDPRSATINTEMGLFVDSPGLAGDMASIIRRDMSGANAWHVQLDGDGKLFWQDDKETLTRQPARNGMQRVMNVLMKLGPKDQY